MPLGERLIEQARQLATRTAQGRPRQDHLRRAVSAAYHGLFHFLFKTTGIRAIVRLYSNVTGRNPDGAG